MFLNKSICQVNVVSKLNEVFFNFNNINKFGLIGYLLNVWNEE